MRSTPSITASCGLLLSSAAPLSTADQHRDARMGEHAVSLAAEQHATDAATPVRGHDDKVASTCPCHIDDRLEDVVAALAQRLTGNSALGGRLGGEGQIAFGVDLAVALLLGSCFLQHVGAVGQFLAARADVGQRADAAVSDHRRRLDAGGARHRECLRHRTPEIEAWVVQVPCRPGRWGAGCDPPSRKGRNPLRKN